MPSPLSGTPIGNILYTFGIGAEAKEARDRKRVAEALRGGGDPSQNYLNDPAGATAKVMGIDPWTGMKLDEDYRAKQGAVRDAQRKTGEADTASVAKYLRGLDPKTADVGAALDELTPFFTETLGIAPETLSNFRTGVLANPEILAGLDDKTFQIMAEDRFSDKVATPGSIIRRGGETVERVPYAMRVEDTPAGTLSRVFNPNTGRYDDSSVTPASGAPQGYAVPTEEPQPGLTEEDGGAILEQAFNSKMISQSDARTVRESFGPNGQSAFNGWLQENGITVVPDNRVPPRAVQQVDVPPSRAARPPEGGPRGAVLGDTATYNPPKPPAPKPQSRVLSPEETERYGYAPGTVVVEDSTGNQKVTQKPPAAQGGRFKAKVSDEQVLAAAKDTKQGLSRMKKAAQDLLNHPAFDQATGSIQGALPSILPGSVEFDAQLSSLKDQVVIQAIKSIKALSATGATGFGSLTEKEGTRLENSLGSLDPRAPKALERTLLEIIDLADSGIATIDATVRAAQGDAQRSGGGGALIITDGQGNRYRYKGAGSTKDIANYERIQ